MLENNSKEMATIVETFIIEETAELIYDNEKLDKYNELIKELGLQGQTKLIKKDKSPIPFMHLKKGLVNVFSELCPVKVNVEDYNITPIPLEILEMVALSKREGHFDYIQIWYDDVKPDPVCVGVKGTKYCPYYSDYPEGMRGKDYELLTEAQRAQVKEWHYHNNIFYLLGKWADVKRSFSELTQMAINKYREAASHKYNKEIKDAQRKLADIEQEAFEIFGSNNTVAQLDSNLF